jgi:hypothetical protein
MRYAGAFAFICAGAQAWAFTRTSGGPVHCMAVPFGSCESMIAAGYAAMLGEGAKAYAQALATTVPLLMWLSIVVSAHNPQMRRRREGKSRLAPVAFLYAGLLVAVLAYGATKLP